ncbi:MULTISPECIES: hypothetical protein [Pseudomonas]|uniref:hypothetical protein n=1 Tax=Pseudomonas TaxID=286 RepID=UPI00070D993E|nr:MULTISPECIES: hypothetical protein [Pseudomonas]KQW19780.1 hypothetical protein ASC85_07985 [Pseudomonas sp. Root401]WHS57359.1 hypothetical protein QLH64_30545 [Pseudomonas brassicacearum]
MKIICFAILGLLTGTAYAAPDAPEQPLPAKYLKEYAVSVAAGYCDVITRTHATTLADTAQMERPDASNEVLHQCQYAHEMNATGCLQVGSCADYESWTQANPAIAPSLPREIFLSALKTRNTKKVSQ